MQSVHPLSRRLRYQNRQHVPATWLYLVVFALPAICSSKVSLSRTFLCSPLPFCSTSPGRALQHQVSFSLAPPVCTAFGHARCCFRGAGVRFARLGKASWPWRALALHSLAAAFSFPLAHSRHRQLVSLHASEVLRIAPTLERNGALEAGLASYRLPDGTLSGVGSSSCCALQSFTTAGLHASGLQDQ